MSPVKGIRFLLGLSFLCMMGTNARAQMTTKCKGQTWETISEAKYGTKDYGVLLAYLNRKPDTAQCPSGRFIRLLGTIKHKVRPGQKIEEIAKRFLRSKGRVTYLRRLNQLPGAKQPQANSIIAIPTEVAVPAKHLSLLLKLITKETLTLYNRVKSQKALSKLRTIYAPVSPGQVLPKPAPKVSTREPATKQPVETSVASQRAEEQTKVQSQVSPPPSREPANQGNIAIVPQGRMEIPKVRQTRNASAIRASYADFTHATHNALLGKERQCQLCHIDSPTPDKPYFDIPEQVCTQCHAIAISDNANQRVNQLALIYSHHQHLDPKGEVAQDYSTACGLCHPAGDEGTRANPTHSTCVKCHNASENKVTVAAHCEACHEPTEKFDRDLSAKLLLADHLKGSVRGSNLVFTHEPHVAQLTQEGLTGDARCETCHSNARASNTLSEIEPQRMSDCLTCHQGLRKVANDTITELDRCQTCHVEQVTSIRPGFSTVVDKPLSHTAFFRKNHQKAAREDEKVCQSCHSSLAGGSGDNCDRCHSQMRPQDHTPRFKEHPHGRAAVRQPERCATCHQSDRCVDCHSIRPRNHFPKRSFLEGGHGREARFSTRKCMTCHQVEAECSRCHNVR